MKQTEPIKIIPFEEKFTEDFKRLNMEWLESYNLFEPVDLKHFDSPLQSIINNGGKILIAAEGNKAVGTSAIIRKDKNTVELAKFTVSNDSQGKGIGKRLAIESIKIAENMGAEMINLVSNSKLSSAIHLYESLGFKHVPLPQDTEEIESGKKKE